jgi:hypothetical protein
LRLRTRLLLLLLLLLRGRAVLRSLLLCGPGLRLRLRLRARLGLDGLWRALRLDWTRLLLCGTVVRLHGPALRLTGTVLRLPRSYRWLTGWLTWACWLNRWLAGSCSWLARVGSWLSGSGLELVWLADLSGPVLRLAWLSRLARPDLRLAWLTGAILRLAGSYYCLAGLRGLAGAVFGLAGPCSGLAGIGSRLAGAGSGLAGTGGEVGPLNAWLRGDGTRGDGNGRTAFVGVVELLTILRCLALDLQLGGHGRGAGCAHGFQFSPLRPYVKAASATVVGDAVAGVPIGNIAVVHVADAVGVNAIDAAVVVEVISVPIAAFVPSAAVAEAVVDATIEADVPAPVAAVEAVAVAIPTPVAGGPERAVVGRSAPGAGNPVVAVRAPGPVAGSPDIVRIGRIGLLVDGEGRGWLVGVFVRLAGIGVELVVVLGILVGGIALVGWVALIGLVALIGWWRGLLLGILLGTLPGWGLRPCPEHLCGSAGGLWLAVVDGCHVGVGGVGPGVVGGGGGVGRAVATGDCCYSGERCEADDQTEENPGGELIHASFSLLACGINPNF